MEEREENIEREETINREEREESINRERRGRKVYIERGEVPWSDVKRDRYSHLSPFSCHQEGKLE